MSARIAAFEGLLVCGTCSDRPKLLVRHLDEPAHRCPRCAPAHRLVSESTLLEALVGQLRSMEMSRLAPVLEAVTPDQHERASFALRELPYALVEAGPGRWRRDALGALIELASWDGHEVRVRWRAPFAWMSTDTGAGAGAQTAMFAQAMDALFRIAAAVETLAPPAAWLTRDQAAVYLQVSVDTLDRVVKNAESMEGGPIDVGDGRRMLRFPTATLDLWFRRASKEPEVSVPRKRRRPKRRPAHQTDVATTTGPVDWSSV